MSRCLEPLRAQVITSRHVDIMSGHVYEGNTVATPSFLKGLVSGEQNVALSSTLSLHICVAKFHAALRAYSSCREVSSGVLSSNFGAQRFRS